jgi:hypothetical protein
MAVSLSLAAEDTQVCRTAPALPVRGRVHPTWWRGEAGGQLCNPTIGRIEYKQSFRATRYFVDFRGDQVARAGNKDTAPVFIVGMPSSGTTLVQQILAAHAQVHSARTNGAPYRGWTGLIRLVRGSSDLHRAADTTGVAEYAKVALDFGRRTRRLFRIVREFHGWPAVD